MYPMNVFLSNTTYHICPIQCPFSYEFSWDLFQSTNNNGPSLPGALTVTGCICSLVKSYQACLPARVTQNTLVIRKTLQAAVSTFHTGVTVLVITFGAHIFREVAFVGEEGEGFRTTGALVLVFFTRLTHVVALLTDSVFRTLC